LKTNHTVDLSTKPEEHRKLFLGEFSNVMRLDSNPFKVFDNLVGLSESSFWFYRELNFTVDKVGWNNLCEASKYMFKTNILYQTVMDSAVANSIPNLMGTLASQPLLRFLYSYIGLQENNHAMSYIYTLENMFGSNETTKLVDSIYTDGEIKTRLQNEVDGYDDLAEAIALNDEDKIKTNILKCLWLQMAIENIRFPASFYNTFAVNSANKFSIPNVIKQIQLIAAEEHKIHIPTTKNIMSIIRRNPEEQGFTQEMLNAADAFGISMLEKVSDSEIEWCQHLCAKGSILNYNPIIMSDFLDYKKTESMDFMGVKVNTKDTPTCVEWYNKAKDINLLNTAQQEQTSGAYLRGLINNKDGLLSALY